MREELKMTDFSISSSVWSRWHLDEARYSEVKPQRANNKCYGPSDDPVVYLFKQKVAERVEFRSKKVNISIPSVQRACRLVKDLPEFEN